MTTSTGILLAGVDEHGDKYRVRKTFPAPYGRVIQLYRDRDEANAAALELERRRKAGLPPSELDADPTLAEACATLLQVKRTHVSRKTRRRLSEDGIAYWTRSLKPWREGELAELRLSQLERRRVAKILREREATAPTSARNERQAFLAVLELAAADGARFDRSLGELPLVAIEKRKRRALSVAELEHFARHVPDYGRRLVLAQATIGNRIDELFGAKPADVDFEAATLFVPAANCKERVDKRIPLTDEELVLLREQLGGLQAVDESSSTAGCPARPAGAEYLFTKREGARWRHSHFERHVWGKAVKRAAEAWRAELELGPREPTPFEWYVDPAAAPADGRRREDDGRRWITTHDLRATAVTLMRDAGIDRADCAARVGHADGGELIDEVYDQGDKAARAARALRDAAAAGLRATLAEPEAGRATSPAARLGSATPEAR